MTSGFRGIPDELIEAAKLDGAGYFEVLRYVIVPMGRPAIILCIIFYFIVTWNDLFSPMILLQSMDKRTVMVALAALTVALLGRSPFPVRWARAGSHPGHPGLCDLPALHHQGHIPGIDEVNRLAKNVTGNSSLRSE